VEYVESYLRRWRDTTHTDHIMDCKVSLQWSILIGSGGKWFVSNGMNLYRRISWMVIVV
jgi:hypothetical protein